jgi:hypothetical protein
VIDRRVGGHTWQGRATRARLQAERGAARCGTAVAATAAARAGAADRSAPIAPAMSTKVTDSPITQQAQRDVSGFRPTCSPQLNVTTNQASGTEIHLCTTPPVNARAQPIIIICHVSLLCVRMYTRAHARVCACASPHADADDGRWVARPHLPLHHCPESPHAGVHEVVPHDKRRRFDREIRNRIIRSVEVCQWRSQAYIKRTRTHTHMHARVQVRASEQAAGSRPGSRRLGWSEP